MVHESHLILGGARSGKSRFALSLARARQCRTAFVATARGSDAGMTARIARHRAERPSSWTTVEEPLAPGPACRRLAPAAELIVLDCATLWVANLMEAGRDDGMILAAAEDLVALLDERRASFLIVSNEVGQGIHPTTDLGLRFVDLMGRVNQRLAASCDRVTLMIAGLPVAVRAPIPLASPVPAVDAP